MARMYLSIENFTCPKEQIKGITVFKIFILGGILWDIWLEIKF